MWNCFTWVIPEGNPAAVASINVFQFWSAKWPGIGLQWILKLQYTHFIYLSSFFPSTNKIYFNFTFFSDIFENILKSWICPSPTNTLVTEQLFNNIARVCWHWMGLLIESICLVNVASYGFNWVFHVRPFRRISVRLSDRSEVTQYKINFIKNCPHWGLNSQPTDHQSHALLTELVRNLLEMSEVSFLLFLAPLHMLDFVYF